MNEPVKNRITVYEVERFCERLHKLVIETHPAQGEPKFELETGTLRVTFPNDIGRTMTQVFHEVVNNGEQPTAIWTPETGVVTVDEPQSKPRKSKKVPQ
jgi:hypothetical protein